MEYGWDRRWLLRDAGLHNQSGASRNERRALALWELGARGNGLALPELRDVPCLVLLGEPGMGKTYAVRMEQQRLRAGQQNDLDARRVDLLGRDPSQPVSDYLFDRDFYRAWTTGRHRLVYFIDSVDKSGADVERVMAAIENELSSADISRLRLRLVCRDHDWSFQFADALRSIWDRNSEVVSNLQVLQLQPLGEHEIRLAAEAYGKDAEQFLIDVETANALPLATVPLTLNMLLNTEKLTSSRRDLFDRGIRELCRGKENGGLSSNDVTKRVDMVARIAAAMVLTNQFSIDTRHETADSSALSVPDLLLDDESQNQEKLVRDTVNTGLFVGSGRRQWIHQSFAEYLTAVYLSRESVQINDIVGLTTASDDQFAQPLYEVLRWLIEMRDDVLEKVVDTQPSLLLTTDLSHLQEKDLRSIYKAMLDLEDVHLYAQHMWSLKRFQASHPAAKRILLPYLSDTKKHKYLRYFVLRLLECHGFPDMDCELERLALDDSEDYELRCLAARGIRDHGSAESRLALKPFIFGNDDDPDDQLKGYALQSLWPQYLSAEELFNALQPPKRENYSGSYSSFIFELKQSDFMKPDAIPAALQWVARQPRRHKMPFSFPDIMYKAMRAAWEHRNMPSVLESFAQAVVVRQKHHDGIFGKKPYSYPPDQDHDAFMRAFADDSEGRRELALLCLKLLIDHDNAASLLRLSQPPLVTSEDTDWLVGLLDASIDVDLRSHVCQMVARTAIDEPAIVYEASERHPDLKILTERQFVSALDDPEVMSRRQYFVEDKQWEKDIALRQAQFKPVKHLEEAISKIETGDVNHSLTVIYYLLVEVTGAGSVEFRPDMTEFPNWNVCDQELQARIVTAARKYVLHFEYKPPETPDENWYASDTIPTAELAGYYALFLLFNLSQDRLAGIPLARWRKWSSIVAWFPLEVLILNDGRKEYHELTRQKQLELLRMFYRTVPQELLNNIRDLLTANDGQEQFIRQDLDKFAHLWGERLESMLLALLREEVLSPKGQRSLLDFLLQQDSEDASHYADGRILESVFATTDRNLVVELCVAQMLGASDFDWSPVWHVILSNEEMGKEIIERVAKEDYHYNSVKGLSERELADLFLWTEERYPSSEDPQIDGVHAVSAREQVGNWRNSLIRRLREK